MGQAWFAGFKSPSHALRGAALVLFFAFSFNLSAQDQASETTAEDVIELEKLSVTGSRIKRTDIEGALPVTIIDREMIERSGETSLSDLLRNLTFNSFGSDISVSAGINMGTNQIDLRGLGSGRSLVLVDGRRLPKSPVSADSGYQNIAMIPLGAVERVEILSDGASSIYGSDAIGGVINIITRRDYTGWELMYGRAEPEWGEGARDQGTVMYGKAWEKSRLLINYSFNNQDISYNRNFPNYEAVESIWGNNFMTVDTDTGFPNWDLTAIPGGCEDSAAFFLVPDEYSLSGELCAYNWNQFASDFTSMETQGLQAKYEHELSDAWRWWTDFSASQVDSFSRMAPAPATSLWDEPLPVDSPNNPTNPSSPLYDPAFGPNVPVDYFHRFEAPGFRDRYREETLIDLQMGVNGWIGQVELDAGLRYSWNDTEEDYFGVLDFERIYEVVADGSYSLGDPASTPQDVLDAMTVNKPGEWSYDQGEVFASLAWDMFETGAGPVQWVVGGEYRREDYMYSSEADDDVDYQLYGSDGADRSTTALFFETLVPLTLGLELSLSGRYDDYSDWGSEFSPKVSMRWRVNEQLVLRGSWGEGFRAPPLVISTLEPVESVNWTDEDPQSCAAIEQEPGCTVPFQAFGVVSPSLRDETSEQYSLGLVWEPAGWFSQTIDYYDITVIDEIATSAPWTPLEYEALGLPSPEGHGVVRAPDGLLLEVYYGFANFDETKTSGMDFNTKLDFRLGPGYWRSDLLWSWVLDYSYTLVDERSPNLAGYVGTPEMRATLTNTYDISDFGLTWIVHYVSSQKGFEDDPADDTSVASWLSHDLQASYKAPWNGIFAIGVQNVTSEKPTTFGRQYDHWLYDFYGRVWYANYTQTFD